ncbi:MAG: ASPIC/UnbV domain-containing protein, partial [Gemmatimonadota bacterium]
TNANPRLWAAIYADGGVGPTREVRSGEGYWSHNEAAQTLGLRGEPTAVRVRWPDGRVTEHSIDEDVRSVVIRADPQ